VDFEWDEDKNAINKAKHGIDFRDAIRVFDDERYLVREDRRGEYGESRYQLLGATGFDVLFVVYTERHGDVVRIISARMATKAERKMYRDGSFY
jgi:uncharacterized DUF497 family protein